MLFVLLEDLLDIPEQTFLTDKEKIENVEIVSKSVPKRHVCRKCSMSFTSIKTLKAHLLTHETSNSVFTCTVCDARFDHQLYLRVHLFDHIKSHFCRICDEGFCQMSELKAHYSKHFGDDCLSTQIEAKSRKFNLEYSEYQQEETVRNGIAGEGSSRSSCKVKRYRICRICDSVIARRNFHAHYLIHEGVKKHVCKMCNKNFLRKEDLKKHYGLMHSDYKRPSCDICGKIISTFQNLQRHRFGHFGIKPYACEICDKAFSDSSSLSKHRAIHTDQKPFVCNICGCKFKKRWGCAKHKLKHFKERSLSLNVSCM